MATIKTFHDYTEAMNFYKNASTDKGMPELHFDPEFGMYEVIYW